MHRALMQIQCGAKLGKARLALLISEDGENGERAVQNLDAIRGRLGFIRRHGGPQYGMTRLLSRRTSLSTVTDIKFHEL